MRVAKGFTRPLRAMFLPVLCLVAATAPRPAAGAELKLSPYLAFNPPPSESPAPTPAEPAPTLDTTSNEPPPPREGELDWIRLSSGEWLRGEIKELQDDSITFDSEELDDVTLDWEDVLELHSPRTNTMLFEHDKGDERKETVTGTVIVRNGLVVVVNSEGEKTYPRQALRTILPGEDSEWNYWSGKLSLGMTVRSGNTEQTDVSALARLKRRSSAARSNLEYSGNFGKIESEESANNHRVLGKHSLFVTRRLYLTPVSVEAFRDPFQNIALRLTPGTGLGYEILNRGAFEWDVEAGMGYQYTRFESVPDGEDRSEEYVAALLGTRFTWEVTKKIDFEFEYNATLGVTRNSSHNHHLLALLSIEVWGDFDIDISFVWDRVGDPQEDSDGNVPKKDDFRMSVGLGLEF